MISPPTLDFYQIFYRDEQREHLYDFSIPYRNDKPTLFLENDVIRTIVPQSKADLIGVYSWQLKRKRNVMPTKYVLKGGDSSLSRQRIFRHPFDVAILTPRLAGHKTFFMAAHWFGKIWTEAFLVLSEFLTEELRINMSNELTYALYENHFIARGPLYREYVQSCLEPVMEFMRQEPIFFRPSGYRKHKEYRAEFDQINHYKEATGMNDWIIGVFLLEHLFSTWINDKNLNVVVL
jgi:hypothetical protein